MTRRRLTVSRLQLFYAMVLIAVMVGASIALDRTGTVVGAQVTAKREKIVVGFEPSGDWDRYYEITAAFSRSDGARAATVVRVPASRYDALRAGDSLAVRYLPQFPAFARTSDRSTATVLREFVQAIAGMSIVMWLAVGVVGFWIAARVNAAAVIAMAAAWAATAWPMFFTPPSGDQPRPAELTAAVRNITLVDRSPARIPQSRRGPQFNRRLTVPYQVVELNVVVAGPDTVLAVDAVDSGSVAGLAAGAQLPVRLDPASPRDAQLAGGTRRFVAENRYHFFVPVIGCVLLGTLAALGYRARRRTAGGHSGAWRATTDASPATPNGGRIIHERGT
jgi:hypothetical protein